MEKYKKSIGGLLGAAVGTLLIQVAAANGVQVTTEAVEAVHTITTLAGVFFAPANAS